MLQLAVGMRVPSMMRLRRVALVWRSSMSKPPEITISRLLKSCATPPVNWSIASIFWACRSVSSDRYVAPLQISPPVFADPPLRRLGSWRDRSLAGAAQARRPRPVGQPRRRSRCPDPADAAGAAASIGDPALVPSAKSNDIRRRPSAALSHALCNETKIGRGAEG